MAKSKQKQGTEKPRVIDLTMTERDSLCHDVLSVDLGPRAELRASRLRRTSLYPTEAEIEEFNLVRVAPGKWGWKDTSLTTLMKTEERPIEFSEKDYQLVRDCYEKLMMLKRGLSSPEHSELKRKFFTDDELETLVDQYDPE